MSSYKDFLNDLPKRTKELLKRHYDNEANLQVDPYEVTLLISLSMPLFACNVEIVKNENKNLGEENKIKNAINNSKGYFLNDISEGWVIGKIHNNIPINNLELHDIQDRKSIKKDDKELFTFLQHIRNGLSHAGIRFFEGSNNKIELIILRSIIDIGNPDKGYNAHIIPVEDYKKFLNRWCDFLIDKKFKLTNASKELENDYRRTGTDD